MRKLAYLMVAMCCLVAPAKSIFGQDSALDELKLEPDTNVAAELDSAGETDNAAEAGDVAEPSAGDSPSVAESATIIRSLLVSARTSNGFTIHGIPIKPEMLPINIYGSDVKIPWHLVSSVQFKPDGGVTVALEDGGRLIGYSTLEELELEKEWGRVRIQRGRLESIHRSQLSSSRQATFRSNGQPVQSTTSFGQATMTNGRNVSGSREVVPVPQYLPK